MGAFMMRGNCIETGEASVMRWINEGARRELGCGEILVCQADEKVPGLWILWLTKPEAPADQVARLMGFKPKTGGEFIGPVKRSRRRKK
jgi:hypothetical protein